MDSHCQTKNLVIVYQKLFNVALKRLKLENNNKQSKSAPIQKISVRSCSSLISFKKLLIDHPLVRHKMEEMCQSGDMLTILMKWKGKFANLAIAIKYYNVLVNLVINPEMVHHWKNVTVKRGQEQRELKQKQNEDQKYDQKLNIPSTNKVSQVQTQFTVPSLEKNFSYFERVVHPMGMQDIFMQHTGSSNIFPKNWTPIGMYPYDGLLPKSPSIESSISFVPCLSRTRNQQKDWFTNQ